MLHLVSYDIEDDKNRTKLATLLLDWGDRVQFSVFHVEAEPDEIIELMKKAARFVAEGDSLRIYRLCATCEAAALGAGRPQVLPPDSESGVIA
ncbi:MAG: CRISPR-associated Cas2 family [Actinobacteria bacterium]|nr:MAG: CRISPR-associated Cas2 family [Actinomycetota bacterium]